LVEQVGVVCHTGESSCFFNEVVPLQIIYLSKVLIKFAKKIGEEASEVIIAAKNENKKDLVGEICDLIYHILVLMQSKNISLDDINIKLQERYCVEGNKKEDRK
jgi:phosphoribosyl-ATP pyrophosphohydrolase/phosphoribosyl-AMP cyclohydrolase